VRLARRWVGAGGGVQPGQQTRGRAAPRPQVHWLRIILDEGHMLGSTAETNRLQLACALRADRRWVMTGGRSGVVSPPRHARGPEKVGSNALSAVSVGVLGPGRCVTQSL